ncbi:MAG: DUF4384 domain-containing protein [Desulfobacterales bacterium]|jgi:hypothetical protein|nr:DUF4384 domain-containing protein [Desulfobacterales bacterium]
MQKFMRSTIAVPLAVLIAALTACFAQAQSGAGDIGFLYAFGAHVEPQAGRGKVVPVQAEASLRAGDRLKLYFEPKGDLHFYLLHLSSQGELNLVVPAAAHSAEIRAGTRLFVPAGAQWFELDGHAGQEKFIMLASGKRLERLEELFARHRTLQDPPELRASADAILNEIKQLRQQHLPLSAPAEKPVRIGGSLRAPQAAGAAALPDITPLAVEITAPGFFSRTFTIDHR